MFHFCGSARRGNPGFPGGSNTANQGHCPPRLVRPLKPPGPPCLMMQEPQPHVPTQPQFDTTKDQPDVTQLLEHQGLDRVSIPMSP